MECHAHECAEKGGCVSFLAKGGECSQGDDPRLRGGFADSGECGNRTGLREIEGEGGGLGWDVRGAKFAIERGYRVGVMGLEGCDRFETSFSIGGKSFEGGSWAHPGGGEIVVVEAAVDDERFFGFGMQGGSDLEVKVAFEVAMDGPEHGVIGTRNLFS